MPGLATSNALLTPAAFAMSGTATVVPSWAVGTEFLATVSTAGVQLPWKASRKIIYEGMSMDLMMKRSLETCQETTSVDQVSGSKHSARGCDVYLLNAGY